MSDFVNTVDSIGDEALTNSIVDRSITEIKDNYTTSIGSYAFRSCSELTTADFPAATSIGTYAFRSCSALATLILRSETMATLSNNNALTVTPIASGTGYIYVPSALVDSYKTATNWSTYAAQFRAIEDYPEVCDPYSWDAVFKNIDNGTYKDVYKVGDTIPLDLGSEGVINMQIAAFDADTLADGTGTAPITFIGKELLATSHAWNVGAVTNADGTYQDGTGCVGGWEKSELRSYLKNTIKPLIMTNVSNRIAEVIKTQIACNTAGTQFTQTTTEDVWTLNNAEVVSTGVYGALFPDASSRRKRLANQSTTYAWWLRSASGSRFPYTRADFVDASGSLSNSYCSEDSRTCLCFCIK